MPLLTIFPNGKYCDIIARITEKIGGFVGGFRDADSVAENGRYSAKLQSSATILINSLNAFEERWSKRGKEHVEYSIDSIFKAMVDMKKSVDYQKIRHGKKTWRVWGRPVIQFYADAVSWIKEIESRFPEYISPDDIKELESLHKDVSQGGSDFYVMK